MLIKPIGYFFKEHFDFHGSFSELPKISKIAFNSVSVYTAFTFGWKRRKYRYLFLDDTFSIAHITKRLLKFQLIKIIVNAIMLKILDYKSPVLTYSHLQNTIIIIAVNIIIYLGAYLVDPKKPFEKKIPSFCHF